MELEHWVSFASIAPEILFREFTTLLMGRVDSN